MSSQFRLNYLLAILKLLMFIFILPFAVEGSRLLYKEIQLNTDINHTLLLASLFICLLFYIFIADLNNLYSKIQKFFFRNSFLSLLLPSLLVIAAIFSFIFPKIFNIPINKEFFIFWGGFVFMMHFIYISHHSRGGSFTTFVNYIFLITVLYIFNIFLFSLYLKTSFPLKAGKLFVETSKEGWGLIHSLFFSFFK